MDLSSELISQFAKITNDNKKEKTESTVYGTTVELDGRIYVKLDGSDRLTPVETTTAVAGDERVMVTIKDHSATITGNISSPAAKDTDVKELGTKIDEFDTIVADKVKAETAEIETAIITKLDGKYATFESLDATYASIKSLEAAEGEIGELKADNVDIKEKLTARDAEINQLKANSLTVEVADAKYATIDDLEATTGEFNSLKSTYGEFVGLTTDKFEAIEGTIADLDVESLNAKYANIDFSNIGKAAMENFYANSGLIKDVVVGDQTITGELVGVTIRGDRIIGGSIIADKLVIKGDDGIYYKLNAEGGATAEQLATEEYQNGLHGSNIIANSITAEKIKVDDLVAFDATIGNFNIGDNSIYSGAKASVDNTTRGIYMDTDGQLNFGDSNNYLKFYKDQNGNYKLDISASSLTMSTSGKNVEDVIEEVQTSANNAQNTANAANTAATNAQTTANNAVNTVNNIQVGGRNYILNSDDGYLSNLTAPYMSGVTYSNENGWRKLTLTGDIKGTEIVHEKHVSLSEPGTYTFSILCKTDASSMGTMISLHNQTQGHSDRPATVTHVQDDIYLISATFAITTDRLQFRCVDFRHFTTVGATYVMFRYPKIEKGNKATDWTPAPEDIEAKITENKASIQVLDNKITSNVSATNALTARVSTVEQTASGLSSRVTSVENMEIGGRNLMPNSEWIASTALTSNVWGTNAQKVYVTYGETYTLSLYYNGVRQTGTTYGIAYAYAYKSDGTIAYYASNGTSPGDYFHTNGNGRVTVTIDENIAYLLIQIGPTNCAAGDVYRVKFEKGNKATDWTPAPEDVEADITTAVNNIQVGGRNFVRNGNFSKGSTHWNNWGSPTTREIIEADNKRWAHIVGTGTAHYQGYAQIDKFYVESGKRYILSATVYGGAENQVFTIGIHYRDSSGTIKTQQWRNWTVGTAPQKITLWLYDIEANFKTINLMIGVSSVSTVYDVYFTDVKIEKGNKATDWSPAPEDIEADIATVQTGVDSNAQKIVEAESNIEQLSNQISSLVRDGSGKSLMTQTSTGWTFSMGDFEAALNNLLAHVKIGTYNSQPCLELVVDDTKQKLMLTNTEIRFMESDTTAAYVSGNTMNIDHAQIDNGLSIGSGYNWAEDSDDILNLIYQ